MNMNILSSFINPQVVPKLCDFLSSAEYKRRLFKIVGYQTVLVKSFFIIFGIFLKISFMFHMMTEYSYSFLGQLIL